MNDNPPRLDDYSLVELADYIASAVAADHALASPELAKALHDALATVGLALAR